MLPLFLAWLHATNDMFSAFLTPMLPRLMEALGVGLGVAATFVSAYAVSSSLLQPLAGLVADRTDRRMLAALGPVLVALGLGALGWWPGYGALIAMLALAGLGSALFHAAGAALVAQYTPPERRGFWMSAFSSSGVVGLALGPLVSVGTAQAFGLKGLLYLVPLALVPALVFLRAAPPARLEARPPGLGALVRVFRGDVARLWGMGVLRSLVFMSYATTLPVWFVAQGLGEARAALALSVYSLSAAVGGVLGGSASDRWGRKRVLVGTLVASLPLYYLMLLLPLGTLGHLVALAVTGAVMNANLPVAVVMAQEHEPSQVATVSGLLMGFTWGFAGLAYSVVGPLIEGFGVLPVLAGLGGLLLPAVYLAGRTADPRVEWV